MKKEMHLEWSGIKRAFIRFEVARCACGEIGQIMSEDRNGSTQDFCKDCFLKECEIMGIKTQFSYPFSRKKGEVWVS